MIGKTISHFKILEKLGSGGMGVVYKAEDTKLDRFVALKFLPLNLIQTEEERKRFIHEAKAASALDHPNICTIHEIDETKLASGEPGDGRMFIAMAYYEGETLKEKIERGPLPIDEAVNLTMQIGQGLLRAHAKGIVHRDIKPANVIVTLRSEVKIVDFGLAKLVGQTKLTKSGTSLGTVAYMSPEQAQGAVVDHRTDIWALGAVLYEMVTGQQPFKGDYEQAVVYSILNEDPEPITGLRTGLPMELATIVNKCLAKAPAERYPHVDEMLVSLTALTETLKAAKLESRPSKETAPKRKRTFLYVGIATLLILLITLTFFFTDRRVSKVIDSIAVLPLDNFSGQEYFADGMTEALIAQLAQISSLRVISRSSVMQYKEKRPPVTEIGRELNVAAIVEGSVFQVGERVRITAQLIEAATDRHLWAKSYERDLRDILALQSEVARAIAREINITLSKDEETSLARSHAVNPAAHEVFLQGQYHLRQGQNAGTQDQTIDQVRRSIEYFRQAVKLDPDWALAHARLAEAYHWVAGIDSPEFQGFWEESKAEARKALALDETVAQAHASLAFVLLRYDRDWAGSEREWRRALELDPNSGHWGYAGLLFRAGRYEDSIEWYRQAEERDPLSSILKSVLGRAYTCAGQYDQAIKHLRNTVALDSTNEWARTFLAVAYLRKSMPEEAIAEVQKALALREISTRLAILGHAYATAGRRDEALNVLDQLLGKNSDHFSLELVELHIALGNKDEALTLLEKAGEERPSDLFDIKCSTVSDSLRDNPRFQDILGRINFPELSFERETRK